MTFRQTRNHYNLNFTVNTRIPEALICQNYLASPVLQKWILSFHSRYWSVGNMTGVQNNKVSCFMKSETFINFSYGFKTPGENPIRRLRALTMTSSRLGRENNNHIIDNLMVFSREWTALSDIIALTALTIY